MKTKTYSKKSTVSMTSIRTSAAPNGLTPFFHPLSVAVIGASREKAKVGHGVLKKLL